MTIAAPATDTATSAAPLAQYSFRRSAFEQERTYTLYPDRLVITGEVPTPVVHELANVRRVHLKYDRTNSGAHYRCLIDAPNRRRLSIVSKHWGGIGNVQDRADTYTPFVRALLLAVSRNPGVKLRAGSVPNFIAALVFTPVMALLTAVAVMMESWWIALGLGALALTCLTMIPRTRPRTVDPANPPANVLP
jgi:hypothetical protein